MVGNWLSYLISSYDTINLAVINFILPILCRSGTEVSRTIESGIVQNVDFNHSIFRSDHPIFFNVHALIFIKLNHFILGGIRWGQTFNHQVGNGAVGWKPKTAPLVVIGNFLLWKLGMYFTI
jgi:hypothetical protein